MRSLARGKRFCAFACVILLTACGSRNADDYLAAAKVDLARNEPRSAIIQLKNGLQKSPDSAEMRFLLGTALLETGEAAAAAAELRRSADLKYPEAKLAPVFAKSLVLTQQYKAVTDRYGNMDFPDAAPTAEVKTHLAASYAAQGAMQQADAAIRAALAADPNNAAALILQARFEAGQRQFDKALANADRVVAASPSNADAWLLKGDLLLFAKTDRKGARDAYSKAIAAKPDSLPARSSMVSMLLAHGDLADAEVQLAELRKIQPKHPQTLYLDAKLAYLKRDNAKAQDLTQQLLKLAPDDGGLLQLAGAIAFNNGALFQADNFLTKALQQMPGEAATRAMLARTQLRAGQASKAIDTLKPLLTATAKELLDPEVYAIAGQAYMMSGDMKQAEINFAQAATVNPRDGRARTALALMRMNGGNFDTTLTELRSISAADTGAYSDFAIASALIRRNDYDDALKAIEVIAKKQPDSPVPSNMRAEVYLRKNDRIQARKSFERALSIDAAYLPAVAGLANLDLVDNKPDDAKRRFDGVLAVDSKNLRALLAVAGLRARAGAPAEEVAGLLRDAVKLNPTEIAPRLVLIDHYLNAGDSNAALAVAQNAVASIADSIELKDALGRAQLAAGDTQQAVVTFKQVVRSRPDSAEAVLRLANAHAKAGEIGEAMDSLRRAIDARPDLLVAQQALMSLTLASKRPEEALRIARTVQRQRPAEATGQLMEAQIYAAQNDLPATASALRAGLKKSPNSDVATKLHSALAAQGKQAEADAFAADWLKQRPNDGKFLFYLGEVAIARSDLSAAEDYFRRTLRTAPDNARSMNNLAWVTLQLKKPGALELAQKANALSPNDAALMDTLALALAADKQLDKAIDVQKKALALVPGSPSMRFGLAKLYVQQGDKASARVELEALAQLPPGKFAAQPQVAELLRTL